MNLRKKLLAVALIVSSFSTWGQTLDDVKRLYTYGRYQTARDMVASIAGTSAEANYYLGLCELALGNKAEAAAIFAKQPNDIANQSGVARVLFADKKNDEAFAILDAMVAKMKKKDFLQLKYAADAVSQSAGVDPSKAVEWYTRLIKIQPTGENYMALGDTYMNVRDGGGNALTNYEKALAANADKSQVYARLGDLWYSARIYDSAAAYYDMAIAADSKNPLPYYRYSEAYYKMGNLALAKTNLEKYIANTDRTPYDLLKLANIYYLVGEHAKAITQFKPLLNNPDYKEFILKKLMVSYTETGDIAQALATKDEYLKLVKPEKVDADDYRIMAKMMQKSPGREAEALALFEKSISVDTSKDKSATYRIIAEDFRDKSDWKNAAKWYNDMIAASPATSINSVDLFYAGFSNYAIQDNATAIKHLLKMTADYPNEPSGFYYLATAQSAVDAKTTTGEAANAYKRYIELVSTNPEKKDQLGKAYAYLIQLAINKSDKAGAIELCNKMLAIDATNPFAKAKLAELKR